jgi:hypothetical protein
MGYFDFSVPSFFGDTPTQDMGGAGVLAPQQGTSWDIPYVEEVPWYQPPTLATGGSIDLENRSNNTWWGVDQSKITASLADVLGSVVQAGAKTAINAAAGSINSAANGKPSGLQALAANFRSTATGLQINAGAQAFSIQNFFSNPMVWFALVGGVILFFVVRK